MKRWLITGGSGFIGSALAWYFLARGEDVLVLDRRPPADRRLRASWIDADVRDAERVRFAVSESDGVFHLASLVGVRHYLETPVEEIAVTIAGTQAVLDACRAASVPMLFTSTSEVYGKTSKAVMAEDDDLVFGPTTATRWCYGLSKAMAEHLILAAAREGQDVRIVRLFNVVGPGQSPEGGLVFPSFVSQVQAGGPIVVHGDGQQTRSFCAVEDIVDGIARIAACPDARGEVVNLGQPVEVTIASLAARFAQLTGVEVAYVPHAEIYGAGFEDTRRRVPDVTKAGRLIGWDPVRLIGLDQIVNRVLEEAR